MTPASNSAARKRKAASEPIPDIAPARDILAEWELTDGDIESVWHSGIDGMAWRLIDLSMDLGDREPSLDLVDQAREDARKLLASAREAAKAEERERIAQAIEAEASDSSYRDPYPATEAYLAAVDIARGGAQ